MSEKANYDWLVESIAQVEAGQTQVHELIEVEDD